MARIARSAFLSGVKYAFVMIAALPAALAAQTAVPPIPASHPGIRAAMDKLRTINAWILEKQIAICQIPAPPFKEAARAAAYRRELIALGYANARIDSIGNVIAELRGGTGPTVMIAGHLDTVFPEGTAVTVKRTGTRLEGPGIGDDCRGLAVILGVARVFKEHNLSPGGRILFVGNVGEEGPGNLRGVRWLFDREYRGQVNYFISVDGIGSNITSRAVGSHRYTVTVSGPGGHSYGDFGMPNPAHALGRAIARIGDIAVPSAPKTTFNVGILRGGTSVNSIAMQAQMDIDMRSESAQELNETDRKIRAAIAAGVADEQARWPASNVKLQIRYDTIGIRPTGSQSDNATIVQVAVAAGKVVGYSSTTNASSTDANIPIALGIPAITIDGGGRGDGAHSLGEWYDDGPDGWKGPQWALLIVAALSGIRAPVQ
jgi:acetylornithine deacetylase/succinyl-diaminopimelate desuccinylase-like protein